MTVTRSKEAESEKIKEAEVDQTRSIGMAIKSEKIKEAEHVTTKSRNFVEVSSNIDVVDIRPKMMTQLRATKPDKHDILTSPPIPFHKQQLATPRLNIANEDKILKDAVKKEDAKKLVAVIAVKKEDINRSEAKKLESRYEGILRIFFVCYIAAVAFFFSIMCRSLFHQHTNANGVAVPDTDVLPVAAIDTNTETRKSHLEFLQAIGNFNVQEDLMPLLPLNAVKEMLSDNQHILDTIGQELGEIIHDTILI